MTITRVHEYNIMEQARAIFKEYPDLRAAVNDVSAIQAVGRTAASFNCCCRAPNWRSWPATPIRF